MRTMSLSEAKMKFSRLVDEVEKTDEEVVITRNGRPAAVLVSPEEFEGWKETLSVRSEPELMAEIRAGAESLRRKKARIYSLDEIFR
ncbi:MAG: type II toxin-antitoxin system Phd/YefM family antitoxin [Deltaproteobacteria bacterium]|nr:type II toxin-antitoxin system Phd/YefM family antitoxin [Deltaproteobacteria bacterium]